MSSFDDMRPVHILEMTRDGCVKHTVTQAFLRAKVHDFMRRTIIIEMDGAKGQRPRVCIAGYMDYLWLYSYCYDYFGGPSKFDNTSPAMPYGFPKHFTYRGILIIESLDKETGYAFA